MKGEIKSVQRPQNSLLEEHLDFKYGGLSRQGKKQEVSITKEFTDNLEKMIKQRIVDEAWDDRVVLLSLYPYN